MAPHTQQTLSKTKHFERFFWEGREIRTQPMYCQYTRLFTFSILKKKNKITMELPYRGDAAQTRTFSYIRGI